MQALERPARANATGRSGTRLIHDPITMTRTRIAHRAFPSIPASSIQTVLCAQDDRPLGLNVSSEWLLLIYTLPSQPSRKRAYVWRELKKVGAFYLRDGVAVLPRRPDLEDRLAAIAERIVEYEGTVDLIVAPHFPEGRRSELVARFNEERASEYREVYHACVRFLRDVLHE